jgi:hypothetical protein
MSREWRDRSTKMLERGWTDLGLPKFSSFIFPVPKQMLK